MANPIARGFRNLTRFSGRDTRGEFWPYVGVVFVLFFFANFILVGSVMVTAFRDMAAFAAEHPEAATVHASPGQYSIQIDGAHPDAPIPDFGLAFIGYPILVLIIVLLLAAAVTRRLHDRDMVGFWGLMPLPFLAAGLTMMPILMTSMTADGTPRFDLFGLLFLNNMIYMAALVTLIIILAQKGTPGPNRYGEPRAIAPVSPPDGWSRSS